MTEYFDTLAGAAKKTLDKGRDKLDKAMLQSRLEKAQRQLGALVYTLEKTSQQNPDMVGHYVREIDRLKQQIQALSTPEADPVSTYECPACGTEVARDAMFCRRCGHKLP